MRNIKKYLIILLVLVFSSFVFSMKIQAHELNEKASTFTCDEKYFDTYTDDDFSLNDERYTISEYKEKLFANNISFSINTSGLTKNIIGDFSIYNDDKIVEFIPRELFMNKGEYKHIGREYGFYVNTNNITDYEYYSEVFVFDIIKSPLNDPNNPSQYVIEVRPLFQEYYIFVTFEDVEKNILSKTKFINKGESNNYIIAVSPLSFYINNLAESELKKILEDDFKSSFYKFIKEEHYSKDLFIKDVTFGLYLQNEQELNIGDIGYNKNNDNGSFISRCNINYSGDSYDGSLDYTKAAVSYGLGFIPYVGILTSTIDFLNEIYNISKTDEANSNVFEDTLELKYYNSKIEQLKNYQNLNKFSKISFKSDPNNPILFKTNGESYIKSFFTIGQTEDWYTRASDYIKIELVKVESTFSNCRVVESISFERTTINYLRSIKNKEITLDEELSFNLLPYGQNKLLFDAKYASDYEILISNMESLKILIDGKEINNYDGIYINFKKGKHYIEIFGQNVNALEIKALIKPLTINSNGGNIIQLSPYEEYIVKINSVDDIYEISTNDSNVLISEVFINNKFGKDYRFGFFNPNTTITIPSYYNSNYVVIKNDSYFSKNINFSRRDTLIIKTDEEQTIEVNDKNYTYFKFETDSTGEFLLKLNSLNNVNICVLDMEKFLYNNGIYYTNSHYKFNVNNKNKIYIGIKSKINSLNLIINKKLSLYKWKITYDNNEEYFFPNSKIEVYRCKNIKFELYYDENLVNNINYEKRDSENGHYGLYSYYFYDNSIIFNDDCPVGGSGIIVKACFNETYIISEIYIIPKMDDHIDKIITELINDENLGFNYSIDKYIYAIDFQVLPLNINYKVNIENDKIINGKRVGFISILNNELKKINTVHNLRIKILKLYYFDNVYKSFSFENICMSDGTINNLYDNYNDIKTYGISSRRHFENISKNPKFKYKLLNDIVLLDWKEFNEFKGKLNGNGNMITMRINIVNYTKDIGLFSKNTGVISNLTLKVQIVLNNSIDEWQNVGGIAGLNEGTIENCNIIKYIDCYKKDFKDNTFIYNVDFYIGTKSKTRIGGITGYNKGSVVGCTVNGLSIMGSGDIGGIAGVSENSPTKKALIDNCKSNCRIFYFYCNENRSVAGIVGFQMSGTVRNCFNNGVISFEINAGNSTTIQPNMAEIIGRNAGQSINNSYEGFVDTEGLDFVWGFFVAFDQRLYAKDREIGRQD